MSYFISHVIAIESSSVTYGDVSFESFKKRIADILSTIKELSNRIDTPDLLFCLSKDLIGRNGSYVVIAGIFDYLDFDAVLEFARRLSKELNTEVLYMGYDHENETIRHQRFERGIPQSKVPEDKLF